MNQTKIQVGDNRYSIEALAPMDALTFGIKVSKLLGSTAEGVIAITQNKGSLGEAIKNMVAGLDAKQAEELIKTALGQCWTHKNQPLRDEAVFNIWFMEHPHDLFELAGRAVYMLAKPYFPKALTTYATSFEGKAAAAMSSMSPSPMAGNQGQ